MMIVALRFGMRALLWAAIGLASGLLLAATLPLAVGDRSFTVMSGSMEPAIGTGDVVVAQPIRPLEARVGNVVTFRDPEGSGRMITHRVRDVREHADGVPSSRRATRTTTPSAGPSPATARSAASPTGCLASASCSSGRVRRWGASC